jgi:hypothetical protein
MANRLLAVALVALAGLLTACGETGPGFASPTARTRPSVSPTPVGLETPKSGSIYLGAFVSAGQFATFESQIGRTLAMDMHYQNWVSQIPGNGAYTDLAAGQFPFESWDCGIPDYNVAAGENDALITTVAQEVKKFGHAVFLRYMWDMNMPNTYLGRQDCWGSNTDNSDGTFSASQYVAAWKHIRSIFAANGVTNVVWIWSFNPAGGDPSAYYPGNSEVDWIGIDAYDASSTSFQSTFASAYAAASQYGKPIAITETGAFASEQSAFFTGAASTLQTSFPMVKAFLYYNGTDSAGNVWSLGKPGLGAFTTFSQVPYMNAFGSV